ncbi:MAG: phosphoribosylaminoimidazolesuccinocarboxamide synthase [Candidatus Pacearchaeota archaeon]
MEEKLLYKGKVKDVYDLNDKLKFKFSNRISVFDQIIPSEIKVKGEVLCRIAKFWFEKVEERKICKTHYIPDDICKNNEMIVKKTKVIPLEFILRHYNAGSYYKRNGGKYGEKLPEPVFEITTKFEKYDRLLTEDEALKISKLKKHDLEYIKETILKIDDLIHEEIDKRGLIHVDGKKEFGLLNGEILLIDTFGTPDEDRFWDKNEYEKGNIVELSKEFVRKHYENLMFVCPKCNEKFSYRDFLYAQREAKLQEPLIPPLPDEKVKEVENLYKTMYERITGMKF